MISQEYNDPYQTKQKFSETKIALHFEISNRVQI